MLPIAIALSLVIGLVLGMLGGGGAILTLPMLVYALKVAPNAAIATSLFVVGATSLVGASVHARAGNVNWKIGVPFGAAAMAGAYVGGRLAHLVSPNALLVGFGAVMIITAVAMLRDRSEGVAKAETLALVRAIALGAGVGALSGLVGAGGGFLIVPALTLFGGLTMRESIGTSLFVITVQSFAGLAGHLAHVALDWPLAAWITTAAILGSLLGARLGAKVSALRLRRAFAWLVIAMGLFMFAKQLPVFVAFAASIFTMVAAGVTLRANRRRSENASSGTFLSPEHSRTDAREPG